jgi:anti-sigma B factor antagonist
MTQLTIDVGERSGQIVVAVQGDVDFASAPQLARALLSHPERDVIVDLSAVGFLDSSGLTALVQAHQRLQRTGHALRTTGERKPVLTVMRIAGLVDVFHGTAERSTHSRAPERTRRRST